MSQVGIQTVCGQDNSTRWKTGFVFFLLAALFHLILLGISLLAFKILKETPSAPAPIEIQNFSPKQLAQIRKQWKQKGILINPDHSPSREKAPPNARYESNKNMHVDKEQKAANATTILKEQGIQTPTSPISKPDKKELPKNFSKHVPSLGSLGIPFKLDEPHQNSAHFLSQSQLKGSDQAYIHDDLPTGSQNLLNTRESVYYSFYERIYYSVGPIWISMLRGSQDQHSESVPEGAYLTAVSVTLDSNGNLLETQVLKGSGAAKFDNIAVLCWTKIDRFPNPPRGLLDSKHQIHIQWLFQVTQSQSPQIQFVLPR